MYKKFFFLIIAFSFLFLLILEKVGADDQFLTDARLFASSLNPRTTGVGYKFQFVTGIELNEGERISISFPNVYNSPITGLGDITCPSNMTASVSERTVYCTINLGEIHSATSTEIIINEITNPSKISPQGVVDIHTLVIITDANERAYILVTIIEQLEVRGTINPILNFEVEGVEIGENIHGQITNVITTASSIIFEDMPVNLSILAAQDLFVTTNAGYGFTVNIIQGREPEAELHGRTHKIHCFINGNCIDYKNAAEWTSPEGILGEIETYGHFGITSEDNSLESDCNQNYYGFGEGGKWTGLQVNIPAEVMRSCGPADGQLRHQGWTRVGFQTEITALQPAGEYETVFTYIITPTF